MLQEYLSIDRTVSMSLLASEQYNVLKTASKHNATALYLFLFSYLNISNKSQHSHSCKCHPPMEWSQVCMNLPYTDDLSYFANIVPCHTHTHTHTHHTHTHHTHTHYTHTHTTHTHTPHTPHHTHTQWALDVN